MRTRRVLILAVSCAVVALLASGCSDDDPTSPAALGSLELHISYTGDLGPVDSHHPVLAFLYEGADADDLGDPYRTEKAYSNPDSVLFESLPTGHYTAWVYFDMNGDGLEHPSPAVATYDPIVIDAGHRAHVEVRFDDRLMLRHGHGESLDDSEAELMALWLSGSLGAPRHLYAAIHTQLSGIRADYGDSIPQVRDIGFWPPWVPGMVIVRVTEDARARLREGEYHDLDSLNAAFGIAEVDTSLLRISSSILLSFEDPLHPERLGEAYEMVPSVVDAYPNGYIGDRPNVYPWKQGNRLTYLFREAWGDCPSGCIHSIYWYFECSEWECGHIGFWDGAKPEPDWWEEAQQGMRAYRGF